MFQRPWQWYRGLDPTAVYRWALVGAFIITVSAFLISTLLWTDPDSVIHRLASSLWQAGIIVSVVTLVIEPYSRRRFLEESATELIWAFANPRVPSQYKQAVRERISQKLLSTRSEWRITFEWEDGTDLLHITLRVKTTCKSYDSVYVPIFKPSYLMSSAASRKSRFLSWEYTPHGSGKTVELDAASLQDYTEELADGSYRLHEDRIYPFELAPDDSFTRTKSAEMYRHPNGYLPIMYKFPNIETTIRVQGAAAGDLTFNIIARGKIHGEGTIGTASPHVVRDFMFPGESLVLSWHPVTEN